MYRIKVKNKETGDESFVWEKYDRERGDFLYFLDFELTQELDKSKYEEITEDTNGIPFNMFGIECGKGWFPLIKPIIEYIDNYNIDKPVNEQIRIIQIKEKYGSLRIYVSYGTRELFDMIDNAELESESICELCGTKENIGSTQGYYTTCCHQCCKKMAKDSGHSYRWHNYANDNLYWIHPNEDDELIDSMTNILSEMP